MRIKRSFETFSYNKILISNKSNLVTHNLDKSKQKSCWVKEVRHKEHGMWCYRAEVKQKDYCALTQIRCRGQLWVMVDGKKVWGNILGWCKVLQLNWGGICWAYIYSFKFIEWHNSDVHFIMHKFYFNKNE